MKSKALLVACLFLSLIFFADSVYYIIGYSISISAGAYVHLEGYWILVTSILKAIGFLAVFVLLLLRLKSLCTSREDEELRQQKKIQKLQSKIDQLKDGE